MCVTCLCQGDNFMCAFTVHTHIPNVFLIRLEKFRLIYHAKENAFSALNDFFLSFWIISFFSIHRLNSLALPDHEPAAKLQRDKKKLTTQKSDYCAKT